jgi:hypothetical protein
MRVMMVVLTVVLLAGCSSSVATHSKMGRADAEKVADMILAMERSALDRWIGGDPSGFLEITAPEVMYFDPEQGQRVDGLPALTQLYETMRGKVRVERYELVNPEIQVTGTAAILTYNYVAYAGSQPHRWNCTEVYCRRGERWWITQTHWSITQATLVARGS